MTGYASLQRSLLTTWFCLSMWGISLGESPNDVIRVEEFWELEIRDPDAASVAPQVTNAFAPCQPGDVLYATFSLNHRMVDGEFAEGGLELALWHDETLLGRRSSDNHGILATANEQITWRQVIDLSESGLLRFSINQGESSTWGNFGSGLSISIATTLQSLNSYAPLDSIGQSGTVYAANRVNYRRLTKVCATLRSGEVQTFTFGAAPN